MDLKRKEVRTLLAALGIAIALVLGFNYLISEKKSKIYSVSFNKIIKHNQSKFYPSVLNIILTQSNR